jgi:predicted HAD superfamily Cof-like phosphohydrolase
MEQLIRWFKRAPAALIVAIALVVVGGVSAGAVVTVHTVSKQVASEAFGKLGGNPQDVLNKIADKVVTKLGSKGGPLTDAQQQIVDRIAAMAAAKFQGVDPSKMLNDVKSQVAAAGLAKIDGIDAQAILNQVTKAVLAQAMAQIGKIDLKSLVGQKVGSLDLNAIVRDQVNKIDVNALVKQELDKVDINALVTQAVEQSLQHNGLLGTLLGGR